MFAIIKTGGKQYIVQPGDKIKIEKIDTSEGNEVSFDALLVSDKETLVGAPYVAGYKVNAKVLGQGRGKKIIVYKYKAKKRYHKKQGHRQSYTEVEILSITNSREGKIAEKKITGKSTDSGTAETAPKRATASTAKVSIAKAKPTAGKKAVAK